jgi:hypothetical protein
MPILDNARHEAFAQARMRGLDVKASYIEAGFKSRKTSPSSAWRLSKRADIQDRIAELRSCQAESVKYDKSYLVRKLVAIIEARPRDGNGDNALCETRVVAGKELHLFPPKLDAIAQLWKMIGADGAAKPGEPVDTLKEWLAKERKYDPLKQGIPC